MTENFIQGKLTEFMDNKDQVSRRKFLKNSMLAAGGITLASNVKISDLYAVIWPESDYLLRNNVYDPSTLAIRSRPSPDAPEIRKMQEDECLPWVKEVIGENPLWNPKKIWVETPEGFIYGSFIQKVRNLPNIPIKDLPKHGEENGFWAEVTVPYVNLDPVNGNVFSPHFQVIKRELWRLYYGQVIWVDAIDVQDDEMVKYRVTERFGSYGDAFWADATKFRQITEEETSPIHPDVEGKKIIVNVDQQSLSCYEGANEVYFCRVSSGKKKDLNWLPVEYWRTPPGTHWIDRKLISLHMSASDGQGTGWDLFGVGWTSFFASGGVAIHSTFWHRNYGVPQSHGCVNVRPEDAKWIFRWSTPVVSYAEGEKTDSSTYTGTVVEVIDNEDF